MDKTLSRRRVSSEFTLQRQRASTALASSRGFPACEGCPTRDDSSYRSSIASMAGRTPAASSATGISGMRYSAKCGGFEPRQRTIPDSSGCPLSHFERSRAEIVIGRSARGEPRDDDSSVIDDCLRQKCFEAFMVLSSQSCRVNNSCEVWFTGHSPCLANSPHR